MVCWMGREEELFSPVFQFLPLRQIFQCARLFEMRMVFSSIYDHSKILVSQVLRWLSGKVCMCTRGGEGVL